MLSLGNHTISYTVHDAAGNTATQQRTITIVDRTPPVLTLRDGLARIFVEVWERGRHGVLHHVQRSHTAPFCLCFSLRSVSLDRRCLCASVCLSAMNVFICRLSLAVCRILRLGHVRLVASLVFLPSCPLSLIIVIFILALCQSARISQAGSTYTDSGASAKDNVDATVDQRVITTGLPIHGTRVGEVVVTFAVMDSSGNKAAPLTRIVVVQVCSEM